MDKRNMGSFILQGAILAVLFIATIGQSQNAQSDKLSKRNGSLLRTAPNRGSLTEILRNVRYCTDMRPDCTCKDLDLTRPAVECHNVTDVENLKHIFSSKAASWYGSISLKTSDLGNLPAQVFGTTQFESYLLGGNKILEVDKDLFKPSKDRAYYIDLSDNSLFHFPFEALEGLESLQYLSLAYNALTQIPENAFSVLPSLQEIWLQRNRIQSIGERAFANLPNVNMIDLSHNRIRNLESQSFNLSDTNTAVYLSLKNNSVNYIHPDSIDLPYDSQLDLTDNNLKVLDGELLPLFRKFAEKSVTVDLSGNKIRCDSTTQWFVDDKNIKKILQGLNC